MNIDVDYIKENGYEVMPNFLTEEQVKQLQDLCDNSPVAMGETWPGQDGKSEYLPNLNHSEYMHWWSYNMSEHAIVQQVKDKIKPIADKCFNGEFEQLGGDFKVTNPNSGYMYCHFDTPYRHDRWANDFGEDIKGMQFGIALDKFDNVSGGTRILPGSHKKVYHKTDMDARKYDDLFLFDGVTMELNAGDLFCYHSRTMHSTMPNNSSKPRRLMLLLHLWNDPTFRHELQQEESKLNA